MSNHCPGCDGVLPTRRYHARRKDDVACPGCPSCASLQATLAEWKRLHACPECAILKTRLLDADAYNGSKEALEFANARLQARLAEVERSREIVICNTTESYIPEPCPECIHLRADLAATREVLRRVTVVLLTLYDAWSRYGWEEGPTLTEAIEAVHDCLCEVGCNPEMKESDEYRSAREGTI